MANVVKKYTISSELAQKMVNEAVAKARELGVTENVAILDDGGNLKAFDRMDGAPILCIEMAQNKAYTALFGVSTQDFFNFIQGDPSLLAGIPTLARVAAWGGGFPIKVNGEVVGAIGLSGAPTVQNDESSPSARTRRAADRAIRARPKWLIPTRPRRRSSSRPTASASPIVASVSRTAYRSFSTSTSPGRWTIGIRR